MDKATHFRVEVRRIGSEKTVVRVEKLNEVEALKVCENLTFPIVKEKGEFEKVILWLRPSDDEAMVQWRREM